MRRLVWCALLLAGISAPGWGQSAGDGSGASARQEAAQIRATAEKLIATGAPDDVAKGAALLEKAAELEQQQANAEKLAMEREKLRRELDALRESHPWRETLVSYIPLATTMILAGTLIFQITRARQERREKQAERDAEAKDKAAERITEAREKQEERFLDALKEIQTSEKVSAAGTLINSFREEPYRTRILDVAVGVMLSRTTMQAFETLYMDVMNPLPYDKLPQMRRLCREVDASYFGIATPIWDESTSMNDVTKLSDEDRKKLELYSQEQLFLSTKLAALLRRHPPAGSKVDLSQLNLRDIDLRGVDLGTANIAGTNWNYVNVDGCDMGRVTEFGGCWMRSTAWWHAAKMSKPLLDYLAEQCPYSPKQPYHTRLPVGQQEYAECLAKLAAGGSGSETAAAGSEIAAAPRRISDADPAAT